MNCPVCTDERLVIADRQGIEIDYCPRCRGVWLDRGELDKLIERSAAAAAPAPAAPLPQAPAPAYPTGNQYGYDDRSYGKPPKDEHYGKPYKKKKSFLGEILDF
jgi:Zn-finger nucleic acid-binding protein